MGIFSGLFKSRDKPQNSTAGSGYRFYLGGTTSGKAVTERSAMQMTAVYSCVRILAEAVAGLPLHLYRYTEGGGKEKAIDHPLYLLLHDEPNPEMSSFVFRETLMTHLLLWGNAYAQIIRNGKNEVVALYPLMPNKMTVDRDANGHLYYSYNRGNDEAIRDKQSTVILRPADVLHIPGLGFDGLVGYSPIAMAKNAIGMAIACEEYGAKFFANGAAPGGVLEHPGTLKDPQRIRESWQSTYGGTGNAHRIAVLEEGMKYTPIGISPEQAQFLETRKFQINEIARIFRVPPHMVGDLEKSSFSNIEQQSLEFVKYTLDPWVIRWEQSIMRTLLSQEEKAQYFVKFNLEGLLRGDYQSRMNGYGSNLNVHQMRWRCPGARIIGTSELMDYRLMFKGSKTGSYLTVEPEQGCKVPVAVWEVTDKDELALDRYEGYPTFYYKAELKLDIKGIRTGKIRKRRVFVYIMHEDRQFGIPSNNYLRVCAQGYRFFGFPTDSLMEAYKYSKERVKHDEEYQTARELTMLDIDSMTLKQIQRHKVRLLDAWRESRAEYGFLQAVNDGFYRIVVDSAAEGFVPRDMWLTDRLNFCLNVAEAREAYLLTLTE